MKSFNFQNILTFLYVPSTDSYLLFIHIVCIGLTAQDLTKGALRDEKTLGAEDVSTTFRLNQSSPVPEPHQTPCYLRLINYCDRIIAYRRAGQKQSAWQMAYVSILLKPIVLERCRAKRDPNYCTTLAIYRVCAVRNIMA